MPKASTYPNIVEDCRTISISFLNKHGYLDSNQSGKIAWSRNERLAARIGISSHHIGDESYLQLQYTVTNSKTDYRQKYEYKIPLEKVPSNLGVGFRYYFRCPFTEKRCMKLYEPAGASIFAHRTYWEMYYESQTKSKGDRLLWAFLDLSRKLEACPQNTRSFYGGKPTRPFLRFMRMSRRLEQLSPIVKASIRAYR